VWEAHVHELGITQGIIDRAREAAHAGDAERVSDLYIIITPAADFTRESIEMYFAMLAGEDPVFAGARLHFEEQPIAALCLDCGEEFIADAPQSACPICRSFTVRLDPRAPMIQLREIGVDDDVAVEDEG
jgi:Zn finger protein HypA/HybF involved in hydrogenase expression